jgi:hypothetical protein
MRGEVSMVLLDGEEHEIGPKQEIYWNLMETLIRGFVRSENEDAEVESVEVPTPLEDNLEIDSERSILEQDGQEIRCKSKAAYAH